MKSVTTISKIPTKICGSWNLNTDIIKTTNLSLPHPNSLVEFVLYTFFWVWKNTPRLYIRCALFHSLTAIVVVDRAALWWMRPKESKHLPFTRKLNANEVIMNSARRFASNSFLLEGNKTKTDIFSLKPYPEHIMFDIYRYNFLEL